MILATILLSATLHAGPERAVSPPLRNGSPYNQYAATVSAGEDVALLVWHEDRGRAAVRIDRDGRVLDERPIVLSATPSYFQTAVARGVGGWLALWQGFASVEGRFVRDDGSITPVLPFASDPLVREARVAFDGTHYLVAWPTWGGGINAVRIDAVGNVVETGIHLGGSEAFDETAVVAFDGGGFAVAAIQRTAGAERTEYSVVAFRLDANADLLSSAVLGRTNTSVLAALLAVADGDTLVATWADWLGPTGENVVVAREQEPLRIIATGTRAFASMKIGGIVYALVNHPATGTTALVSEDGAVNRTVGTATTGAIGASFGDRALLGMTIKPGDEFDVATAIIDATLQEVVPPRRIELEPPMQERPAAARNAYGETLAVWVESGGADGPAVMGARLDGAGRSLGAAFVVGRLTQHGYALPQVASDGTDFLVAWYDLGEPGTRTARVLRDGTALEPFNHPLGYSQLCLAWNGADYLLGYPRITASGRFIWHAEVRATRFSREGAAGETMLVSPEVQYFDHLSCAATEDATLFVFAGNTSVQGALLTRGGTLSSPFRIGSTEVNIGDTLRKRVRTAVAANGDRFLAAWTTYDAQVRWALVSEEGTPSVINQAVGIDEGLRNIAAAPHGDGFFIAWQSFGDVLGLALDETGHNTGSVPVSATPRMESDVALTGGDALMALYQREPGSELQPPRWRVFAKTFTEHTQRRRAVRN